MKALPAALLLGLAACGAREEPARDVGEELFADAAVSSSPFNAFSCATCHTVGEHPAPAVVGAAHAGRVTPGFDLAGAPRRRGWWGGYETRLLDAMNRCVVDFMGGAPLAADDARARSLDAYLAATPGAASDPWPLTVVKTVSPLANLTGSAAAGAGVYARSCRDCHGAPHTGSDRLNERVSIIPEATVRAFPTNAREVVIEKVRHGRYFNIGGVMPLYPAEALSDQELVDVVAYLGL